MKMKSFIFFIVIFGLLVFPSLGVAVEGGEEGIRGRVGLEGEEAEGVEEVVKPVILYFFWGNGCPHCAKEEVFLEKLEDEFPNLEIKDFEVWFNSENAKLLKKVGKEMGIDSGRIPLTIVGNKVINSYDSDETTGVALRQVILEYQEEGAPDLVGDIIAGRGTQKGEKTIPDEIDLPFFGTVKVKNLSLPVLTIVIAALDGFNPCAMWVLLFLISLLVNMANKKRMWILGVAFIGASALVYFLFLTAWLNLFLFLGFIFWVRIVVGVVAVASGVYHLREYWVNKDGTCKVTHGQKRQRIFEKLKRVTQMKSFWIALGGIILLAFAVNLVELVCSAGLPAVYTNVLSLSGLAVWQYYAYLLLYILIFMADDLLIFFIAMKTFQMTGLSHKYSRFSNLVGGIIILLLGVLLLIKPGWLMFG